MTCRFGVKHITEDGYNVVNKEVNNEYLQSGKSTFKNHLTYELLLKLRKRTYDFSLAETTVKNNDKRRQLEKEMKESNDVKTDSILNENRTSGTVTDEDIIKMRECEKKKIDWKDKLYLSPLTTVGNLPFR